MMNSKETNAKRKKIEIEGDNISESPNKEFK